jgi:Spy/CpxP family protein refolding chaperone
VITRLWGIMRALTFALLLLGSPAVMSAQDSAEKLLGQYLYPPELVMQNQQRIELRPAQRVAITQAIQQMQARVVDLQWRIQEETQELADLLKGSTVSEDAVLAQVDRVLSIEREIKREHMGMLVRIKNTLTPEQQAALRALR